MAGSKTSKRRTSGRTASSKKKKKQAAANGFQNDIILLVILAASIILLVSDFGLGGIVGNGISSFFFGIMGVLAYAFPVVFFIGAAFLLSNKTSPLARKKVAAAAVFFLALCGLVQLVTEGYISGNHTGGLLQGVFCIPYRRRPYRWCDLHFHHFCIWYGRRLCDHRYGADGMPGADHPEVLFRICFP